MENTESKQKSELIWSKLFCISNKNLDKKAQLNLIEDEIIKIAQEQRLVGRKSMLNHFKIEVQNLEKL